MSNWIPTVWELEDQPHPRSRAYNHALSIYRMPSREGVIRFAVRTRGGSCVNKDGEVEYEPSPSNRTDEFFERCRYATFDKAMKAADTWTEENT